MSGMIVVGVGCAIALTACKPALETTKVADAIKAELKDRANLPLKNVLCPSTVERKANGAFVCVAELDSKTLFNVAVVQKDDQGTVEWTVDNSKAVLNLTKLQTEFQTALNRQGEPETQVDCGGTYRVNKPGETFECKTVKQNKPGAILVSLDPVGNVTWNEIIEKPPAKAAKQSTTATQTAAKPGTPTDTTETSATEPDAAAAPSGKNADDFLNQPGATENIED